jgi:predicted DNA-binding transcriptional regulator YafY
MAPLDRIQRLLRLVELLQSGRSLNSSQLAEICKVSRRTVFRDIGTLRGSGIAVNYDEDRRTYTMPSSMLLPAANFTLQETLSLLLVSYELGDERKGIPFQAAARAAALKLLGNLPRQMRERLSQRTEAISVRLDPHSDPKEAAPIFQLLTQAIAERRPLRIQYKSLTEWNDITTALSPYRILFSRRNWYVIGRSSVHRSVRTFNVGRIKSAEPIGGQFRIPQRFSLDRYLGNAWHLIRDKGRHRVVVRFEKQVASNVAEVNWHKTQSLRWNDDGTLDFRATVDGLGEIVWWILGYGRQAEVLHPPELRAMIAEHVTALAEIYGLNPQAHSNGRKNDHEVSTKRISGSRPPRRPQSDAKKPS